MGQSKKVPTRTCTGCREEKNKKDLIRIVRNKDGEVFVDITGKQNGRGAYICHNRACLEKAVKNRGLERTLKISKLQEDVVAQLMEQLGEEHE
ncbi:MAG: YlxR family protein [Eubacterium sp.]|nr:YlxR family protein [Eubacterium sp.]